MYEKEGLHHPNLAGILDGLAELRSQKGEVSIAIQTQARSNDIREYNLSNILSTGSEDQKRLYLATLRNNTDATISLHIRHAPNSPQAARLALTTILRRKGRALDAMTDQIKLLRNRANPQDRAVLEKLATARSQLSTLMLGGPDKVTAGTYQGRVASAEGEIERLEVEIGRRSMEFRVVSQPITLEEVQKAISPDAALVEIMVYRPYDPRIPDIDARFGSSHYVCYVLYSDGSLRWADLGESASVDHSIAELRAALRSPSRSDVKLVARTLDERVMHPIRSLLGGKRKLLLSPDGALNLIPFEALVNENDRYLIEDYSVTYVTSGRDLLRLQIHAEGKNSPLVIANPTYDLSKTGLVAADYRRSEASDNRRSVDFTSLEYPPLPGTADEARQIQKLVPDSQVLTEAQATEAALKQAQSPRILHIATHGFFLPDQPQDGNPEVARKLTMNSTRLQSNPRWENPSLRSGLVLAGVKQQHSGAGEDGVLTALESAGLNLWGTKLVVLSACETGLGDVKTGEGVYGLRRALVLAGSKAQVISLWKVDDAATRDLMVGYYKRLQVGEGRTEALRQTKLEMVYGKQPGDAGRGRGLGVNSNSKIVKQDWSHPYYWASFIQSGEWRPL